MNILVTGGAGFIGSHLCDRLLERGHRVTAVDDLSLGRERNVAHLRDHRGFEFQHLSVLDDDAFGSVVSQGEFDCVFHLAANSDIARSHASPSVDFDRTFLTTFKVLEAMRRHGIAQLVFASTSAIYGEAPELVPENHGPLQPISHYGAGKLASEAFISSYAENYGIRSWITRFPNVVGPRGTHGAVYDFVQRLIVDPTKLVVFGNGTQQKPYLYVTDLIKAMLTVWDRMEGPVNVCNVGVASATTVADIARFVIEEGGLDAEITYTGGDRGWVGDVPRFSYDTRRIEGLGWLASMSSDDAIRAAARAIWEESR